MSDNINFKELWARQTAIAPDSEDLIAEIKMLKKSNLKKLVITNITLMATSLFIVLIWLYYQPQLLTTKIGIVFIILSMVMYLFAYNKSYTLFKTQLDTKSNSDYLKDLLAIKAKQNFMEKIILNLYFVLLSLGIGLYMYEYTSRMKPVSGIITYGITSIWILYNWFYARPRQLKKQKDKLDAIISKFEMVNTQLQQ